MTRSALVRTSAACLSLCGVLVSSTIFAQERVAEFDVSASVGVRCKVESRGDIAFGSLDPAQAVNTFSATEVRVACTRGAVYRLNVDNGRSFSTALTTRQMTSTRGEALPYALAIDSRGGHGHGWFSPSIVRLSASVRGLDYVDLPGGQYQDVIRISVEY